MSKFVYMTMRNSVCRSANDRTMTSPWQNKVGQQLVGSALFGASVQKKWPVIYED